MPANLPPEYFEAEKRYKQAVTTAEKVAALEGLIATVPKHKGTDKLRADFRRKLSQLRKEAQTKRKGGKTDLYVVQKEGAAQMALVGFPNCGKSSILASITNANPVIAAYPMSTVLPFPGMMPFEDIQFKLIDLPPIGNESTDGWVSGILRYSDGLLLVVDIGEDPDIQAELLIDQLQQWNIFLFTKQGTQQILHEKIRSGVVKRSLIVANKNDLQKSEKSFNNLKEKYANLYNYISVSAHKKQNLEKLKRAIFDMSGVIRVYSKPPGKDPDLSTPFTIPVGSTILDLAEFIHKDFIVNLKYAKIWGSAKFEGQRVEKSHVLQDRDIIEFHV